MYKNIVKWLSLGIVSSAIFLSVLDLFIVNVALPTIKSGLGGSDSDMQFIIVMYVVGYAALLITGGRAGEIYGKKRIFIVGVSIFVIASAACGLSQTSWQLNTLRLVQGISAALMVPQGLAFIPELFPDPKERVKAFGIYGSIAGAASVIGQFLGGLLPETHLLTEGWRLIFLINVPLGTVSILLALKYLKDSRHISAGKLDLVAVCLLMVCLITFIYPLIQGRELHWPWWILSLFWISALSLFSFVHHQRTVIKQGKQSLIHAIGFKYRSFNIGLLAALFYYMVQDSYFLINTIQLQTGFGVHSSATGLYFVYQGIGYVLASFFSARLLIHYDKYVVIGGVIIMVFMLLFHIWTFTSDHFNPSRIPYLFFFYGVGCGTALPSMTTISLKSIPASLVGTLSGIYLTFQQIAVALGVAIIGGIFFDTSSSWPSAESYRQAYCNATSVQLIFLVIAILILSRLSGHKKSTEHA